MPRYRPHRSLTGWEPTGGDVALGGELTFTGLHVFSGAQPRDDGISGWAHVMGGAVADVDTSTGGTGHDMRRPAVLHRWSRRVRSGEFDVLYAGGPCATFSPRHEPQLRTVWEAEGMELMPDAWRAHVAAANDLWDATARLAREQFYAGGEFVIEYPQRRYLHGKRAYWRSMATRGVATPGDMPSILELERVVGAVRIDIAQCALGGRFQKFTTLLCSPRIARQLQHLSARRCDRCDRYEAHEERATGVFPDGSSRAAAAAAYPSELCRELAAAGRACPRERRRTPPAATEESGRVLSVLPPHTDSDDGDGSDSDGEGLSDGLSDVETVRAADRAGSGGPPPAVSEDSVAIAVAGLHHTRGTGAEGGGPDGIAAGPELPAAVRARVDSARVAPPRFASLRNLADASSLELRRASMPHLDAVQSEAHPAPTAAAWGSNGVGPQEGRPEGAIAIEQLFQSGVFGQIETWRVRAEAAMRAIAAGVPATPPATLVIPQTELQPWARGLIWDTRDPRDCCPVTPSTADTPAVCGRSLDREKLREDAERLGWPDRDMVGQSGGGGIESRSECNGDTVLSFHHAGIVDYFAAADEAVRADVAAGSVLSGFHTLPFVPCRSLPKNVILQSRSRVLPTGEVEDYDKPRVTTNLSDGIGEVGADGVAPRSVNEGVPERERFVRLPTVRQLGRGAAIVGEAGRADGLKAELYCFDLSSAYRFAQLQARDWWQHVFLWLSPDGRAEWLVDAHGAFGGAYMPQRFERITNFGVACARAAQDAFDEAHPYPPGVRAWRRERAELQRRGLLPPGREQLRPAYAHVYIDDGAGAALNDTVPVPAELAHVPLGALATHTLGGVPSAYDSRAAVHLRIAVAQFERLGFVVEVTKTECGSAIVNLGFRLRVEAGRIDCPLPKRRILLRDVRALRAAVEAGDALEQRAVERLTGRLAHMSHVMPEVASSLAGGYAVAAAKLPRRRRATTARRPRRVRVGEVRLRRGGRCEAAVREMCDVAEHLLEGNEGSALAASAHFAAVGTPGTVTTVTDASGDDGVGGYAFHADSPGTVWVFADPWPDDVAAALAHAASTRATRDRTAAAPACSMPLAELFGPYALASAVSEHLDTVAVISVVDCAPAAAVLSAATSCGAQLRSLVVAARRDVTQWMAAAVPRELNVDADTLSHPPRWGEGDARWEAWDARWAAAAGLEVRRVRAPERCWTALRTAMALPMGREAAAWREEGELALSASGAPAPRRRRHAGRPWLRPRAEAGNAPTRTPTHTQHYPSR